jgi:hypothetical protein
MAKEHSAREWTMGLRLFRDRRGGGATVTRHASSRVSSMAAKCARLGPSVRDRWLVCIILHTESANPTYVSHVNPQFMAPPIPASVLCAHG